MGAGGRGAVPALTRPFGGGWGSQEPFTIANPGAATNATFTCDGRGRRRLITLVFTLTTDANAANRYVTVEYRGIASAAYAVNAASVLVTASSTQRFAGSIDRGVAEWNTGTDVLFPLEDVFIHPSDTVVIAVSGMQAGDTLTGIRGVMERFPMDAFDLPERED
jgi:hypothetical protein